MPQPLSDFPLDPILEVLDTARDGAPRSIAATARSPQQAAALIKQLSIAAERRGFVPVDVSRYRAASSQALDALGERTLLLVAGTQSSRDDAAATLAQAAARSPRPHVLLSVVSRRTTTNSLVVREAQVAYAAPSRAPTYPADVEGHLLRANRAVTFEREGRHAAAERLLRDVAGALVRRGAWTPAAATLLRLAQLLIERGRAGDADRVCDEAADAASRGPGGPIVEARVWQAVARTDAGRLSEAESICRALLAAGSMSAMAAAWVRATLARILLHQDRVDEAVALDLALPFDRHDSTGPVSWIQATCVKVLLAAGAVFEAGRETDRLLQSTAEVADPLPRIVAATARLRMQTATGDLTGAERSVRDVQMLARQAHLPLRAARARLIWHDALARAGDEGRLRPERVWLDRVRRVAPPLLRRRIEARITCALSPEREAVTSPARVSHANSRLAQRVLTLLRLAHDEGSDADCVRRVVVWLFEQLRPARVEVLSADAGPATVVLSVGTGLATEVGIRVLESGLTIRDRVRGGEEIGQPVRQGPRLIAALAARWPVDLEPPPDATEVLDIAAYVMATALDGMLFDARAAANAATEVPELLGSSAVMTELRRAVRRAATAPFSVLIEGESGAGKELVARAIHQLGPRRERRFCDINCAALPDDLLEAELFGHARGAFTGAVIDRPGLFEEATGGTLFLDELPDLSARGQAKLLRVIQQQEVRRIGESFSRRVDVRLVTATNRDMRKEVEAGRFRSDLLYRLDVIRIRIPPLRERAADIPVLAEHFWRAAAARVGTAATLTHGVYAALSRYAWPGNVRELQNTMSALAVAAPVRGRVRESLLPVAITGAAAMRATRLDEARTAFERRFVEAALARAAGNRSRAADDLGLSRQGLLKLMARLGIE